MTPMRWGGSHEYYGVVGSHFNGEFFKRCNMKRLLATLLLSMVFVSSALHAERIKDIARLAGVRINQLIGYGLVIGLDGTGDKSGTTFTQQGFRNMLVQLGINIPPGTKLNSKNIAAVMVTTNLRSFMKKGQLIDVNVSSIGDSKSLRGGTLLMTPLKGADGQVYAVAQGNLVVGGLGVNSQSGSSITVNVPSGGRIPNGATVERDVANPFANTKQLIYNLNSPDFTTARRLADAVNKTMGAGTARALDAISVAVTTPKNSKHRVEYISVLENIEFKPGVMPARVIVNARTGTVVIGRKVIVGPAAVSHGNLVVTITENNLVSQPNALSGGVTAVNPNSQIDVEEKDDRAFVFAPGTSLNDIVNAINAVGAGPGELVSILEALKEVGALNARLIVI